MDNIASKEVLIVGQGLAGTVLAHELINRKISFNIIDNSNEKCASLAAGGLVHPMSFKRLIPAWKARESIAYAQDFYRKVGEVTLKKQLYQQLPLFRPFDSIEEQNDWYSKMEDPVVKGLIDKTDVIIEGLSSPFGLGVVHLSGRLDVSQFLTLSRSFFEERLINSQFEFNLLIKSKEKWMYKDIAYDKIIFCEGFQYVKNPYFSHLPNNLTKGEILVINSNSISKKLMSKGVFVMPADNNEFIVGSTYKWNDRSDNISKDARVELEGKLHKMGLKQYEVIDQKTGIRPTTHDRKPLIGWHSYFKNIGIFNGMGSRTVSLAPLLAKEYLDSWEGECTFDKEADISRLEKKFPFNLDQYERTKMQSM